ncbi:MAG: lamin tail domain-containing protein [Prevotellaceae bacterium]|nr:lamin tail domain-containing protein [Candidatus Minthosoma caballi]
MDRFIKSLAIAVGMAIAPCAMTLAQEWKDVTNDFLVNPKFENGMDGWSWYGSPVVNNGCVYSFTSDWFDLGQWVTLPKGDYRFECNGFQQLGILNTALNKHRNGNENFCVWLQARFSDGAYDKPISCIFDEERDDAYEGSIKASNDKYYPSTIEGARACFDKGMYKNILEFRLDSAQGVNLYAYSYENAPNAWYAYSNFRLYRYGDIVRTESIALNETELALIPTELYQMVAEVSPENADYNSVWWRSSDRSVATVSSTGVVKAVGYGECTITAESLDPENPITANCTVKVEKPSTTAAELVVNELMASNGGMFMDPSFNYGSWIELYNPTDDKILLGGLYVSDDAENLRKFQLPLQLGIIPSKSYSTVWFDHNGIWNQGEINQVNFKLDYDGGTIYLSDDNGIVLQQEYPEAIGRTSYARLQDGGEEWGITYTPTPGASNKSSKFAAEQVEAPVFSRDGGLFTDDIISVSISAPNDAEVYITYDSSVPTQDHYDYKTHGTFELTAGYNTVIRARAFKDGFIPSEVVTRTYIKDQGFTLPIISVNGDYEDIYGWDHGIMYSSAWNGEAPNGRPGNGQYSNKNYNMEWDRPVNFEYITADGEYALSQEVDMSMCGGWSRAYTPHSFKLKAAKYHMGKGTMEYPFFSAKPYLKHKTLQIRQGGNDNNSRIKDAALQQVVLRSGLYIDAQESQPVHVFINGGYHATLNMREPNNKHFAYSNYGIDTDDMDQFGMSPDSGYVQKEGTDESFLRWYELSEQADDPDVFDEIAQMVDIDEYVNYMAVQFYLANKDWPQNNIKGFRDRKDGRFHFVLFDLDQAFETPDGSVFTVFAGKKNYTFNELLGQDGFGNYLGGRQIKEEIKMVTIFLNMLKNDTFRKRFIDTFCIVGGSVFEPSRVKEIVGDVRDKMVKARNAMNSDFRKNTYDQDALYSPATSASAIISKLTTDRNNTMMTALKNYAPMELKSVTAKNMRLSSNISDATLLINDIEVPTGKFVGKVFCPAVFTVKAPAGYRFRGWTKSVLTSLTPDEYEYISTDPSYELPATSSPTILRAIFEPISEEDMIATNHRPIMINEVCAKNAMHINDYGKKADWIELYNTTDNDIDIAGLYLTDNLDKPTKYQIPVGDEKLNTIIPAHGYKIVWTDKNESISDQLHADFKLDADSGMVMITASPYIASASLFTAAFPGEWTDSLNYNAMEKGQTIGRYPDGGMSTYLMTIPTIGKSNQLSFYSAPIWMNPFEVAIPAVEVESLADGTAQYFTISGTRIPRPQPGLNIVKLGNGQVKKIFIK